MSNVRYSGLRSESDGFLLDPLKLVGKFLKQVYRSSILVRYFTYIVPVTLLLLIPQLLAVLKFKRASISGVYLSGFMLWLQIVWLALWIGRFISRAFPYLIQFLASSFMFGGRKWREIAQTAEIPATMFLWSMAAYTTFLPIMTSNKVNEDSSERRWEHNTNMVLLTLFIATALNLAEKIFIHLLAVSFHIRTYGDRIESNKFHIKCLTKLFVYAQKLNPDLCMDNLHIGKKSHNRMRKSVLVQARSGAQVAVNKFSAILGKFAADFAGKDGPSSISAYQLILLLVETTEGSNLLAQNLYQAYAQNGRKNLRESDLRVAFTDDEEAEQAFVLFDRDLNGDISCEEMELCCVEIGRERKAINASLKDLDSVVGKLNDLLVFLVMIIVVLVFVSMLSQSTATVLTSASSSVLALSWLFSATAQEFLASIIFVFVKHPFDVGDRVDIYNTGTGTVDTFFVKSVTLMYTEFKKLEGHIVQAPNSLLNTLFILNMRRSGALAEAVPIVCKFGTELHQIEALRDRMLKFVKAEKREYQSKIITELRDIPNMHAVNINVVFFYKSNWQNELVRLQRRNKFMCALMCTVSELGIESPNMRWPGQKESAPVYLQTVSMEFSQHAIPAIHRDPSQTDVLKTPRRNQEANLPKSPHQSSQSLNYQINRSARTSRSIRGNISDFSLGVKEMVAMDDTSNVFDNGSLENAFTSTCSSANDSFAHHSHPIKSGSDDYSNLRKSHGFSEEVKFTMEDKFKRISGHAEISAKTPSQGEAKILPTNTEPFEIAWCATPPPLHLPPPLFTNLSRSQPHLRTNENFYK